VVATTFAAAAHAQFGGSVGLDSDYRYRGVSLSDSRPSPRLTLNYDATQHWYAGASATRAALTPTETYTQWSGYAGLTTQPVGGRSFEIGLDGSHFAGLSAFDFAEVYAGVLAQTWSARIYYAPDYYGHRTQVAYVEGNAFVPIARGVRWFAHVGALAPLQGASDDAAKPRFDVSLGAGLALSGVDLHLAVVAVTRRGPYPAVYNGRCAAVVVGASFSF
jgi:uncharacterized protein (TIGR02001 family)